MAVGHAFVCDRCGAEAGRVMIWAPGEAIPGRGGVDEVERVMSQFDNSAAGRARLTVVSGVGDVSFAEFDLEASLAALGAGDARALHAIDVELVPFWCPRCRASYCGRHWETWELYDDGFFDEKRGRCPRGHERKLID